MLRKIADGYLAKMRLPAWLSEKKINASNKSSLKSKPDTEENDIEEMVVGDKNEEEENEINMKIPKNYEEDSLQKMFDSNMFNMYEEGWNSNGTPADFVFQDGVKVMYDEVAISDLKEFAVYYKEQIGYRNMSGSSKEIYGKSVDTNSTYFFTFILDFSARPDLLTCDDEVPRVTVTELQLDGATGYIAGNVEIAGCFDQKKLRAWLKNIIETNSRVGFDKFPAINLVPAINLNTINKTMKVTLVINDNTDSTIELGYEEIANVVSSLADKETNATIFGLLAKHSSVNVREAVASKDKLGEATVVLLANDPEVAVSRSLVRSEKAREHLSTEQLTAMSKRDVDTAENIAGYVEAYKNADADELADTLSQHSDPRVRCALASNSGTAKKVVKKLTNDLDRKVQAAARETLNNY